MFTEGIFPIGDGLLDIDENRLKGLLVPHDINEIYEVEQTPFARGKFAAVRRAIHKNSGVHFAAKFLKRRRRAQSSDKEIKHEIAVLTLCDGAENIVKLNAVHESRSETALLLDLATGGELQTFLDNEECLNEVQTRFCMREVLKALQFLHKRSIVHLDLKPQNILLTGEHIEDGLKLCDFGISRVVAEGTNVREIVGTPDYVAPEVLQYEPLSLLTDIWSVGVLAYVLLSGFSPFGGETKQETFLNISQCALTFPDKLFGGVSAAAIDFMRRALRIRPSDRMTAAGCLEHFWLKDDCSIDRHIFGSSTVSSKETNNDHDVDNSKHVAGDDDDDDDDEEEDEHEHEHEEGEVENDVDDAANGAHGKVDANDTPTADKPHDEFHNSSNSHCMDASDAEDQQQQEQEQRQQHMSLSNGHVTHNDVFMLTTTQLPKAPASATKTTKTTSHYNVPAMRATTIPLCNMQLQHIQQQQHQQQLLITARRHSSDSNKENTFLTTKHIMPATATNGHIAVSKSVNNTTSIATIMIAPASELSENVVATVTLPIAAGHSNHSCNDKTAATISAAQCLFPDAPTTPKVIRKTPSADASPTSVKALVRKFQLEGSSSPPATVEKHLKEAQINQQPHPQPHPQPQQQQKEHLYTTNGTTNSTCNGISSRKPPSPSPKTAATTNGIKEVNRSLSATTTSENNKKSHHKYNNNNSNHISNMHIHTTNIRRCSEPITSMQKKTIVLTGTHPLTPPPSTVSTTTVAANLKASLYGLTCNGGHSNSISNGSSSNGCAAKAVTVCRHAVTNGVGSTSSSNSNSKLTSPLTPTSPAPHSNGSSSNSKSNNTAAAILLNNHQQLQQHHHHRHHALSHSHAHAHAHAHHHHHHHHVAAKSAAATNSLSLDQGIIC